MDAHAAELLQVALWLLVAMGGIGLALIKYEATKFIGRMDTQDQKLGAIEALLESETKKLREMQHAIDVRLTRVEATLFRQSV